LYDYNFPSCFLLPFIFEALFTVALPYHLAFRFVGAFRMPLPVAEALLAPFPMELGRYGDILVNLSLAAMCFFTASGWVLWTLLGLLMGNVFIYLFDHFRVLRHVENINLPSGRIDALAAQLLAIPCGLLAAASAFQLYGLGFRLPPPFAHVGIWLFSFAALLLHAALHFAAVRFLAPRLGRVAGEQTEVSYEEVAKTCAANFFNMNPVHCLRSKFIHKQSPPCVFYAKGKEHVLERNKDLGQYYEGSPSGVARVWSENATRYQTPGFMQGLRWLSGRHL